MAPQSMALGAASRSSSGERADAGNESATRGNDRADSGGSGGSGGAYAGDGGDNGRNGGIGGDSDGDGTAAAVPRLARSSGAPRAARHTASAMLNDEQPDISCRPRLDTLGT